jgi:hypothetical protein
MITALLFALKDIRHDWARALLGIASLAVVVFSYQMLASLSDTFTDFTRTPNVTRNLIVIQADFIDPADATLDPQALQAAQELDSSLVQQVSPLIFHHIRVEGHLVQLRAAALEDWEPVYHLTLQEGKWPGAEGEIATGESAARANGWGLGTHLNIYGSDFRITGIYRAPGSNFATLWMPLEQAQRLYGPEQPFNGMTVQVATAADIEEVRARLQSDARIAGKYTVFFEDNYTYRNNQAMKDIRALASLASGLALLAVIFGTYNATSLSLVERSREAGILRAVGFSHFHLRVFLMLRALLAGAAAYLLGTGAAWAFALWQQAGEQIFILGVQLTFRISPQQVISGALWTAALALLGAWLSSRRLVSLGVAPLLQD